MGIEARVSIKMLNSSDTTLLYVGTPDFLDDGGLIPDPWGLQ
jgi:hypothetical protein